MLDSDKEIDLVKDYYEKYPVLKYILPGLKIDGIDVTHRVHMLRQAMWVLVQILKMDDSEFNGPGENDPNKISLIKDIPVHIFLRDAIILAISQHAQTTGTVDRLCNEIWEFVEGCLLPIYWTNTELNTMLKAVINFIDGIKKNHDYETWNTEANKFVDVTQIPKLNLTENIKENDIKKFSDYLITFIKSIFDADNYLDKPHLLYDNDIYICANMMFKLGTQKFINTDKLSKLGITTYDITLLAIFMGYVKKHYDSPDNNGDIKKIMVDILASPIYYNGFLPEPANFLEILNLLITGKNKAYQLISLTDVKDDQIKLSVDIKIVAPQPIDIGDKQRHPLYNELIGELPKFAKSIKTKYNPIFSIEVSKIFKDYPINLLKDAIIVISTKELQEPIILMIATLAENSQYESMKPLVDEPKTGNKYKFIQNENGKYVLGFYDNNGELKISDEYSKFLNEISSADACRAFGGSSYDSSEITACKRMTSLCLGEGNHNIEHCRAFFGSSYIDKLADNFRGWYNISKENKSYYAYRILDGLGIPLKLDDKGEGIRSYEGYTDDDIATLLGFDESTSFRKEKIEYIRKLMEFVEPIKVEKRAQKYPYIYQNAEFKPPIVRRFKAITIPNLALPIMRPLFGGGQYENHIKGASIQYGGKEEIKRITEQLFKRLDDLEKRGKVLPQDKRDFIIGKIGALNDLSSHIDVVEKILNDYLMITSYYGANASIFSKEEIEAFNQFRSEQQENVAKKLSKFDNLNVRLLAYSI